MHFVFERERVPHFTIFRHFSDWTSGKTHLWCSISVLLIATAAILLLPFSTVCVLLFFFYKNSHINIHKSQVATACMSLSKNSAPSLAKPGDVLHRVQKCNQRLLCGINIIFIVFIFASERIELKFETTIYSMPQSHRVMHFWMPAKSL